MYLCNCNGISEGEVRAAVELGCNTLHDLRRDLGVAACCGKCEPDARSLLERCSACPATAAHTGGHD